MARWEGYFREMSAKCGWTYLGELAFPSGACLHLDSDGHPVNITTSEFPCGWDERDAKV